MSKRKKKEHTSKQTNNSNNNKQEQKEKNNTTTIEICRAADSEVLGKMVTTFANPEKLNSRSVVCQLAVKLIEK